jgi:hypothetical protein
MRNVEDGQRRDRRRRASGEFNDEFPVQLTGAHIVRYQAEFRAGGTGHKSGEYRLQTAGKAPGISIPGAAIIGARDGD